MRTVLLLSVFPRPGVHCQATIVRPQAGPQPCMLVCCPRGVHTDVLTCAVGSSCA